MADSLCVQPVYSHSFADFNPANKLGDFGGYFDRVGLDNFHCKPKVFQLLQLPNHQLLSPYSDYLAELRIQQLHIHIRLVRDHVDPPFQCQGNCNSVYWDHSALIDLSVLNNDSVFAQADHLRLLVPVFKRPHRHSLQVPNHQPRHPDLPAEKTDDSAEGENQPGVGRSAAQIHQGQNR